jgi:hypothetical protein
MKKILPTLFLLAISFYLKAQSQNDSTKQFVVESNIIQDKRLNELVLKNILINEERKEKTKGYRVQIHFSIEKAKALETKSKFTNQYQNIPAYLDYQQPYFKIRVGDFRTKLEAYKLLQDISGNFQGAFIVIDDIELPKLD